MRFAHEPFEREALWDAPWIAGRAVGRLILLGLAIMGVRLLSRKRQIDGSSEGLGIS